MKLWIPAAAAVLLAACSGAPEPAARPETPWEYRPSAGFVHTETMEHYGPQEFFQYGLRLRDAKSFAEAAGVFQLIADFAPDAALRARALFMRGTILMTEGAYLEAYRAFESYVARYPEGELSTRAKQAMMECAVGLATVGQEDSFLGIIPTRSAKPGIELLKSTLQRFPREEFSDAYYFKLAEFYYGRGQLAEAELELRFILSEPSYKRSRSAPRALLMLGKIGLDRYGGASYDHKTLADAKRAYEQFELDYKRYLETPGTWPELGLEDLPGMLATARAGIAFVNERMAEREFLLAEFYLARDQAPSARLYLAGILKNYPNTSWAKRADQLLRDLEPTAP